jgi:3-deoxy-D-manno-octulosonic-acid transferase
LILSFIYNVVIGIYGVLMNFAGLFHPKAKKWREGRTSIVSKYNSFVRPEAKLVWIHCASLGEFEQGRPVIETIKRNHQNVKILLTFFSPSGYEIRKNYELADYVSYLPIDTPGEVNRFLNTYSPDLALFVKYEFWRNFIKGLHERQIPIYSFSTIFRKNQLFFKSYGGFFREILFKFDKIFVQDQESLNLLDDIQYQNGILAGDTRFDRVHEISVQLTENPVVKSFKEDSPIVILGSVWKEDMELMIPFINRYPNYKYIIAPHEINSTEIDSWSKDINLDCINYSTLVKAHSSAQVLFIDNIGILSTLFQFASIAYIGGAFGKGLHNTLEAATFGLPIVFGNKNYSKFKEANDMIALKTAFPVKNFNELISIFEYIELNKININQKQKNYVEANLGSSQKIINHLGL